MEEDLKQLARRKFRMFTHAIVELIKNQQFDLIIAAGNSGVVAAKITELIYEKQGSQCPPILQLPVVRFENRNESVKFTKNHLILPLILENLQKYNVNAISNVLFVDDEIRWGNSAGEAIRLLVEAVKKASIPIHEINYFIIAEDHTTEQGLYDLGVSEVKKHFMPYDKNDHQGVNNAILRYLPEEIENPVKIALAGSIEDLKWVNILLTLPISEKMNIEKPEFVYTFNTMAEEKVNNLKDLQAAALEYTKKLIQESISS